MNISALLKKINFQHQTNRELIVYLQNQCGIIATREDIIEEDYKKKIQTYAPWIKMELTADSQSLNEIDLISDSAHSLKELLKILKEQPEKKVLVINQYLEDLGIEIKDRQIISKSLIGLKPKEIAEQLLSLVEIYS